MVEKRRHLWEFPWGYTESFIISGGLLCIGFILEATTSVERFQLPSYPINLFLLIGFCLYLIITAFILKNPLMQWFSSIPASVAAIVTYSILIILMGFIPQDIQRGNAIIRMFALNHIVNSFPFIIISIFLLMVLGYTIIRRLRQPLSIRNIAFFLNHGGLFLVIITAALGSGDFLRVRMPIQIKQTSNIAFIDQKHYVELPFHLRLDTFFIEEYEPELALINKHTGQIILHGRSVLPHIRPGVSGKYGKYQFEVLEYLPFAFRINDEFFSMHHFGATHAARIRINHVEGWISAGNFMFEPKFLNINEHVAAVMLEPKAQKYVSVITYRRPGTHTTGQYRIEVNKPLKLGQWTIYQASYDEQLGRWSKLSVLDIVRDPWLPVVYIGIAMLFLGSLYLLITGRRPLQASQKQ